MVIATPIIRVEARPSFLYLAIPYLFAAVIEVDRPAEGLPFFEYRRANVIGHCHELWAGGCHLVLDLFVRPERWP